MSFCLQIHSILRKSAHSARRGSKVGLDSQRSGVWVGAKCGNGNYAWRCMWRCSTLQWLMQRAALTRAARCVFESESCLCSDDAFLCCIHPLRGKPFVRWESMHGAFLLHLPHDGRMSRGGKRDDRCASRFPPRWGCCGRLCSWEPSAGACHYIICSVLLGLL